MRIAYTSRMSTRRSAPYADSLAFLLSQIGARSAHLFAERLVPFGVSPRAFGILSNLDSAESQTQQQLADALGIHRNNMVGLIDDMEAAGWVRRHRNEQDRRAFDVRLTDAGSALVVQVSAVIPAIDDQIGSALSGAERQTMLSLLRRVGDPMGLSPGIHPHLRSTAR